MTYLLDDLEKANLIARRPDPSDRRARRVELTDPGQQRLAGLRAEMAQVDDHVLAALPPAERAAFRSALQRVAAGLAVVDPVPNACSVVEEISAATAEPAKPRRRSASAR
jgi:DNA-binding PadR family transcriptional regulator